MSPSSGQLLADRTAADGIKEIDLGAGHASASDTLCGRVLAALRDFGLSSGQQPDGTYTRVWFNEELPADEVVFDSGVYLLTKQRAKTLKSTPAAAAGTPLAEPLTSEPALSPAPLPGPPVPGEPRTRRVRITGNIPPELWNRLGTKLIPKLRAGEELLVGIDITVQVEGTSSLESELRLILKDLDLTDRVQVESS